MGCSCCARRPRSPVRGEFELTKEGAVVTATEGVQPAHPGEEGYYQRTAEVAAGAAWRLGSDGNFDVPCLLVGVVMSVLHRFFSSGDGYVSVHRFHSLMAVELQAGGAELALAADDDGDSVEAVCDELRDRGHVQLHVIDMAFEDYYSEWNPLPHFDD